MDNALNLAAPATGLDAGPACSAGLAGIAEPPEQDLYEFRRSGAFVR